MMRALLCRQAGGPETLTVARLPIPEPGPGEVRRLTALVDGVVLTALIEADPDPRAVGRKALHEVLESLPRV